MQNSIKEEIVGMLEAATRPRKKGKVGRLLNLVYLVLFATLFYGLGHVDRQTENVMAFEQDNRVYYADRLDHIEELLAQNGCHCDHADQVDAAP